MTGMQAPGVNAFHKRDRSSNALASLEGEPALKHRELSHACSTPVLEPILGESKASYFQRLAGSVDCSLFRPAHVFDRDGIYLYKRPIRSASNQGALLAQGGSVFHHCVVYVKQGGQVTSLEFGPANFADITANLMEEAAPGPVVCEAPAPPEADCLPMMHIAAQHHPLDAQHVQQALRFAESRPYHALHNNCIGFADFVVRVLTGGGVRSAPLIYDHIVGKVPPQDSPLLGFLFLATQMTWFQLCDGSRLMAAFLQQHPATLPLPPAAPSSAAAMAASGPAAALPRQHQQQQQGVRASVAQAAAAATAEAEEAAAAAAAGAGTCRAAHATPAAAAAHQSLQDAWHQEAGSVVVAPGAAAAAATAAPAAARAAPADSSLSEGTSWAPPGGLQRVLSTLRSSDSSRSLASVAGGAPRAGAGAKFDPLGRAASRRE